MNNVITINCSEFSKDLSAFTSAGVPDGPNDPHLERAGHNHLTLSWNKPESNGGEYHLVSLTRPLHLKTFIITKCTKIKFSYSLFVHLQLK